MLWTIVVILIVLWALGFLSAYTAGGAYASFMDRETGIIAPGMLADLTVIDKDLRTIAPEDIRNAKILRTFAGGKTVFSR